MSLAQRQSSPASVLVCSADTIDTMKSTLATLRQQLATDTEYFRHVYNYTFEFSRPPGQRSLGLDMAQGFWAILIPHGLSGGALAHVASSREDDDDVAMDVGEEGWKEDFTQWWFEFLEQNGMKGVSKDVWQMVSARLRTLGVLCSPEWVAVLTQFDVPQFLEFVRTIDSKFEKYDAEGV